MTARVPTGRPRGRPRLTDEERAARAADRAEVNRVRVERQRSGKVFRSLFLDEGQAQRVDELIEIFGFSGAGELVEWLIAGAPDTVPPVDGAP